MNTGDAPMSVDVAALRERIAHLRAIANEVSYDPSGAPECRGTEAVYVEVPTLHALLDAYEREQEQRNDLTAAYMVGFEKGKDATRASEGAAVAPPQIEGDYAALRQRIEALAAELGSDARGSVWTDDFTDEDRGRKDAYERCADMLRAALQGETSDG